MGLGICPTHYWNKKITAKEIFTMKEIILGNHIRKVPSVAVGCMRLSEKSKDEIVLFMQLWNKAHISLITRISTVMV